MNQIRRIQSSVIFLALLSYVCCTLVAYLIFPTAYSPTKNWLSDLGNIDRNPQGAFFYNLGVILTGLLVLLFFLGLSQWEIKNHKLQNLMVRITQLFGIFGSLALIMSAIFPINLPQQHEFWSVALYILLGTAFGFSVSALRYQPKCPKWVLILGGLTALIDILSGIFHENTSFEWVTVGLFLIYLITLSVKSRELQGKQ